MFGLPTTDYDEVQQIKKELSLLHKLYGLYNDVSHKVNGYYEIPWIEVDTDKINGELQEFQTRYSFIAVKNIIGIIE